MHGNIQLASKKQRTPSGQYSRAGEKDHPPTQIKRLLDDLRSARDPRRGSELGRLYLQGALTESMFSAGTRWAVQAARHRKAIGAFPVRAASMEVGRGGTPPDPDSEEGQKIAKREADNAEKFFAAHASLVQSGGLLVESIVRRTCEHDEAVIGFDDLAKLRRGLLILATHWNLTANGK